MATETDVLKETGYVVPHATVTPQFAPRAAAVAVPATHGEKPEKFTGVDFKDAQKLKEGEGDVEYVSAVEAWNHSDFLCRNYVLNGLADSLYNVFCEKKTAKELWESLDRKQQEFRKTIISPVAAKINVVEHDQSSKKITFSTSNKKLNLRPKGGISKKRLSGKCYNYDDMGHKASEFNLVGSNSREWWIDTGATRHVCSNNEMFATLEESENGEKLFMGNSATSEIKGQGKVVLKMTSGKELTLTM
ncbi:uncharacterized protein LOC142510485 [Primulina tabacum]|uniref:uncharacterized protein LOC142510485 n=1 Tax=Primulina tabacum TaxID=48773 RepID=UPI003F595811